MIKIVECTDIQQLTGLLERREDAQADVDAAVREVLEDVEKNGDAALLRYCEKFDGVRLDTLAVSEREMEEAFARTDEYFLETLRQAADNIRAYHRKQIRTNYLVNEQPGVLLGQKITAIAKVGVYVPGGTARYPSSVLMNVVPAKLAGVKQIVMVTPAGPDGNVPGSILAAARIAGVDRVFKLGGAQAVAALAYGTESVPAVDKIVGPGNIYVATAKRMVYGKVAIDMIAGPSEILVIADGTANPAYVAADMLSQAEHDKLSSAWLVTTSMDLAEEVARELERQLAELPREEIARASIESNGRIVVTDTLERAVEVSNLIAPEHLEVAVDDPFALLDSITNAGSIFLGKNVPEAIGDYFAGANHTLPTSGTARFSSPLSVDDYVKKSSFLYYSRDALEKVKDRVADFARREGLDAHARSLTIRFEK